MYPRAVVSMSLARRLDIIAICDHNSSENVPYVIKCAEGTGLTVLAGMEIMSSEEVHVLALFDKLENINPLQDIVYRHLPGKNDEDVFGCQAIVNEHDEVEGLSERLLIGATTLPLQQIVGEIHRLGGLAIAAHIDRESFGIFGSSGSSPTTSRWMPSRYPAGRESPGDGAAGPNSRGSPSSNPPIPTSSPILERELPGRSWRMPRRPS